jgi:hypothetical protein
MISHLLDGGHGLAVYLHLHRVDGLLALVNLVKTEDLAHGRFQFVLVDFEGGKLTKEAKLDVGLPWRVSDRLILCHDICAC